MQQAGAVVVVVDAEAEVDESESRTTYTRWTGPVVSSSAVADDGDFRRCRWRPLVPSDRMTSTGSGVAAILLLLIAGAWSNWVECLEGTTAAGAAVGSLLAGPCCVTENRTGWCSRRRREGST